MHWLERIGYEFFMTWNIINKSLTQDEITTKYKQKQHQELFFGFSIIYFL